MTSSRPEPASAFLEQATRYQVVRRFIRAAAHSDARLIAEAAALSGGWAALVDPVRRLVCSTPDTAGPEALRTAAHPLLRPHVTIRKMIGGVLVIRPDPASPVSRTGLIARTTIDLLRMRARVRQADEIQQAEQRLHTALLHLLPAAAVTSPHGDGDCVLLMASQRQTREVNSVLCPDLAAAGSLPAALEQLAADLGVDLTMVPHEGGSPVTAGIASPHQALHRPAQTFDALLQASRYARAMRERMPMAATARWLLIWVVFTIVMCFVTGLAGIYQGWLNTAVTSASIVAVWFLGSWFRSRRQRKAATS
ncbi:hypothetical protein ACH4JS_12555 [Streptomyces sp. NPDC017638]|uniref:hypothetical protein n=1 Tax=Streptomyces sp. NPDC017638 TaxID=3365004 RepID=UPI00378C5329